MNYAEALRRLETLLDQGPQEPTLTPGKWAAPAILAGRFNGRNTSIKFGAYRWLSGGSTLDAPGLTDMLLFYPDLLVSWLIESFAPSHQLIIEFQCNSPMTIVLGQGGEPCDFAQQVTQRFISNKPDLCRRWLSQVEVNQSIAALYRDHWAKLILYRVGGTVLEVRLLSAARPDSNAPRILELASILAESLDNLTR